MAIWHNQQKITGLWIGGQEVTAVYHGADKVYEEDGGYPSGTVLFEATAGTYTLTVEHNCTVRLDMCGGGSGGYYVKSINTTIPWKGCSAGYVYGNISLAKGTYSVIVGAGGAAKYTSSGGDSSFLSNIAGGGASNAGGTTTVVTSGLTGSNGTLRSTTGRIGGYGAGGAAGANGTSGYCKIVVV